MCVTINGKIAKTFHADGGVYYIAIKEEILGRAAYIGFVDFKSHEIAYEKKLPSDLADVSIKKMMATGDVVYILAGDQTTSTGEGKLYRVPVNTMEAAERPGVLDATLAGEDVVLLSKQDTGICVVKNELSVPVSLKGEEPVSIGGVMDARLVFVKSGDETEVIDITTGRSLYQYSAGHEYLSPGDYTITIEAVDDAGSEQEDREMIFYKVFIDGLEAGRTESGPAGLPREFRMNLEANRYHLVRMERWLLKAGKGRYERENNIRQPKSQQIFIPMNRIVKLIIKFDGKSYRYDVAPVYRQ
ncbi:MAG: hypothetical protein JW807_04860 [Spirochaetes bacterium]|nr:hypothetical protein [Spirochaetota bacterium]